MNFHKYFIFLTVIALAFSACKKEDEIEPYISFDSPNEGAPFVVLDTISVKADVSDNERLDFVQLSLLNAQYVPVASTISIPVDGKEVTVNRAYPIDNIHLESGDYYLMIMASDGVNESRKYRRVNIAELPRELKAVYFVDTEGVSSVNLHLISPEFNAEQVRSFSGDFLDIQANSHDQLLYFCGKTEGDLNVLETENHSLAWSVPENSQSGAPYFTALHVDERSAWVSIYDQEIREYSKSGVINSLIDILGYSNSTLFRSEDYLFTDQINIGTTNRKFKVYFAQSNNLTQEVLSPFTSTAMAQRNDDKMLVVGNENGQGFLKEYSLSANGFWEPHSLPAGEVKDIIRIDNNNFIIAHETGVYWFSYNPLSMTTFLSVSDPQAVAYDTVNNLVVVAVGNQVKFYTFPAGNLAATVSHSAEIKGLALLYNK